MQNFETVFEEHEKLINQAVFHLKIYRNFEEFYQLGRIALWEATIKYDPKKSAFEPFAFMMIKFKMVKEISQSNQISEFESVLEETQFQFALDEQSTAVDEFKEIEWLMLLPEQERVLLKLAFFEDRTNRDIAKMLGSTEEAVKKRRQRLVKKVREMLMGEMK
ncbi:sigma-70 family RNA polymerase sigma factor [Solibacillus sp. FSL K6-1523]|uniref:sigma-70 family RNA polymerase sigma factor n=1 Tax=Solibacillus sp. FSL K6-1523 TaxID=2921471 RepID=UPI0030F73B0D